MGGVAFKLPPIWLENGLDNYFFIEKKKQEYEAN